MDTRFGLDLGQLTDPAALVEVERCWHSIGPRGTELVSDPDDEEPEDHFWVREIRTWPAGTSYPAIVGEVCRRLATTLGRRVLAFDRTNIGSPVAKLFRTAYYADEMGSAWIPREYTITGGGDAFGTVTAADLVGTLSVLLGAGRLHVPAALEGASQLRRELEIYGWRSAQGGRVVFAATDGGRGALAGALAIACHTRMAGSPRSIGGGLVDSR